MRDTSALAIAGLGIVALVQMLVTGRASPSRFGFSRKDDPLIYWCAFIAGVLLTIVLLYFAVFGGLR